MIVETLQNELNLANWQVEKVIKLIDRQKGKNHKQNR